MTDCKESNDKNDNLNEGQRLELLVNVVLDIVEEEMAICDE